jgi:mRNA interferase YafQ
MSQLVWHNSFRQAFKRLTKRDVHLKEKVIQTLKLLEENPKNPRLKSHKLSGQLKEYWACQADYDCRIIFSFSKHPETNEDILILIDIGSNDDVY